MELIQRQLPSRRVLACGDTVEFILSNVPDGSVGFVRTNLGMAAVGRREQVDALEHSLPAIGRDWRDLPMTASDVSGEWRLAIPLTEVGRFEAKCFAMRGKTITWAAGDNFVIKSEPAVNAGANTVYTAFVRQFGPNKYNLERSTGGDKAAALLEQQKYTVLPASGTFRDLVRELDFIIDKMGFRIIQLLPIHPTPVTFGRMGRFGSPFAAQDYFAVDPALAQFDHSATPMDQFCELVDAVHSRRARVFMDIPVNHTGWGSKFQCDHPEWFVREADGRFVSPGAWGVVWEDLCKLEYSPELCGEMAEVFLFWCRRGVDGFRCDAGYMLPETAWNYIVAKVRSQYPRTTFLLEGLGGPQATQERLLGVSGLNWAYSELFQYFERGQIEYYYSRIAAGSRTRGILVNYAETHDNTRLAAVSHKWSHMRCAITALLSDAGCFGITNGVEFFAAERVDVHSDSALNWGAAPNQVDFITRLNRLLSVNPCFFASADWQFVQQGSGNFLAALRTSGDGRKHLLCLFNLDREQPCEAVWRATPVAGRVFDLLSGAERSIGPAGPLQLAPGEVLAFSTDADDLAQLAESGLFQEPEVSERQRLRWTAAALWSHFHRTRSLDCPVDELADRLYESYSGYFDYLSGFAPASYIGYQLDEDLRRQVMVFSRSVLAVTSASPFSMSILDAAGKVLWSDCSVRVAGGGNVAFGFFPEFDGGAAVELTVEFELYRERRVSHRTGHLLLLGTGHAATIRLESGRRELVDRDRYALLTNNLGGYAQIPSSWGDLRSKYDALLAANCNAKVPEDRRVMFTRCRAFMVFRDFSFRLDDSCFEAWRLGFPNQAEWEFAIPAGQGLTVHLKLRVEFALSGNAVKLAFSRKPSAGAYQLADMEPVKIILRPDIEDRVNHTVTKAFSGPEHRFPAATAVVGDGFDFQPGANTLKMRLPGGRFVRQPEWTYMVSLPRERYYGLEDATDLFSPGYFEFTLNGGASAVLEAVVEFSGSPAVRWPDNPEFPGTLPLPEALARAVDSFVVKRDSLHTIIAGYPWFLDWGRDTLIALRGLIAAGKTAEVSAIVRKFATFEQQGTIPNMIHGSDVSNRDTTDAPLWLIVAVSDFVRHTGSRDILSSRCGKRKLLDILLSVAAYYRRGTPNGIRMDSESKLIFSPAHFTWMDTNYPAATPREGYPGGIQALWYAALRFLSEYEPELGVLADSVAESVKNLYYLGPGEGLSDCLHCVAGVPAALAVRDNAVRPNQLLCITLGLITDREIQLSILRAAEKLLIPGAIRSLSDAEVYPPLPVSWHGALLNNPSRPYRGSYRGPEDTERKVAYHNGTAWCWQFPLYVEALRMVGGVEATDMALGYLNSGQVLMREAVPWQMPEVADGDWPHRWGGCGAQAWSATEFLRVWKLVEEATESG
ncbi:MAG: amylo-alpha-1,6-glucosidase [Victivallaceae bacterium]|nr:amylo-alpha-1,6-glucosidase [Victivallaceae bacterium]